MFSGPFFLLCLAIGFGWASADETYPFVRLFDIIALTVSEKYVEPVDSEKMVKAGVDGLMEKLDPYSQYLVGPDYEYLMQETQGEYCGIGISLEKRNDTLCVISTYENSPAQNGDIRIGDRLLYIDSINIIGKTKSECLNLLRGTENSTVQVTVRRPVSGGEFKIELRRTEIMVDPVPYYGVDDNGIGYIRIARFTEGSAQQVELVLRELMQKKISGLIIDLRGNPGGLLFESVEVAALFLKKDDKIVETRGRAAFGSHSYKANADGIYTTGPLSVVIDDQTASAAEILAGAIQDHDRGLVIGSASYGKGLVQQVIQFSTGSALKLTTAKYYTPSDRCIQKDSIAGDLVISPNSPEQIVFMTDSHRPVFSGGGIIPDIYVDRLKTPPILKQLMDQGYISDFIAKYNSRTPIADNFVIDDGILEDFYGYLKNQGFSFKSPQQTAFKKFVDDNDLSANAGRLKDHLEIISQILAERSNEEANSVKTQLRDLLFENFISQCLGQKKAIELVWLKNHPELIKAKEIIKNPQAYANILANY
jgi:carboxyl-terminal processing protease